MSKQSEFAVILKMNPLFSDLGAEELQRMSALCHTQQLGAGESLAHLDFVLRHFGHQDRLALGGEQQERAEGQRYAERRAGHSGTTV